MDNNRNSHKIAEEILDLVDSGTYQIGSRLPSERDLAVKFGVSRACIREGQIVLEALGHLEVKSRSGAYVVNGSADRLSSLPNVESFELTEAHFIFEAEVAALAAPLITDNSIQELERLAGIIRGKVISDMTADEADAAFHKLIASATNNRVIMFVIDSMWKMRREVMQLQKIHYKVYSKEVSSLAGEHHAILEALKNRNPAEARGAVQNHFNRIMNALLAASEVDAYQDMKRKTSETRSRFLLSSQLS